MSHTHTTIYTRTHTRTHTTQFNVVNTNDPYLTFAEIVSE